MDNPNIINKQPSVIIFHFLFTINRKEVIITQIQNSSCHPCQEDMTVIESSPKQTNGQPVLKSYVDFDCTREWTAFVVPFRKREEHLPHFLEAISEHQLQNSQHNVSAK